MTSRTFALTFHDNRVLHAFTKTLESICAYSDTAMLKVKSRGVYVMLSDFESFCCVEARLVENLDEMLYITQPEFTAKFLLDSLTNALRKVAKAKRQAVIYGVAQHKLYVDQIHGSRVENTYAISSAEHRPRVFYVMSTTRFCKQPHVRLRIANAEFSKLVNVLAILSGTCGGVGYVNVQPRRNDACTLHFYTSNDAGGRGGLKVHTSKSASTAPLLTTCQQEFTVKYFITYLKRAQALMHVPQDMLTLYVSPQGLLLQTPTQDHHSVLAFVADVTNEDINSYS